MTDLTPTPYADHLKHHLLTYIRDDIAAEARIAALTDVVLALALLDLEPVRDHLTRCYDAHHGGRRQRDPIALLRTFIVMALLGEHRINHFIDHLRAHPELRILCGFTLTDQRDQPDRGPGVATLYDFIARLLDGPPPPRSVRARWIRPTHRRRGRKFLRSIDQEKLARHNARPAIKRARAVLDEVTREAAATGHTHRLDSFSGRLQQLLAIAAVVPSAKHGILPRQLDLAADATVLRTHASSLGHEPTEPTEPDHRYYSDPTATWGYNATAKEHYFGHKAHAWVARAGKRDLPLWIHVDAAHEPDVILAERDLPDLVHLLGTHLPGHTLHAIAADAAYDAEAFHQQIERYGAAPIIAHNKANPLRAEADTDPNGVPLCPGDIPMRRTGYNRRRDVVTYNCPAKRPTHRGGESLFVFHVGDCPRRQQCDPQSKMGPLIHIRPSANPRMNLPIPRGSAQFATLYKARTAAERFFGVLKTLGKLGARPYRRRWVFQMMATAHAIALHARAWVDARFGWVPARIDALLDRLAALRGEREEAPTGA